MKREMPFSRSERMSQQIHRELANIFLEGGLRDPRLEGIMVMSVKLTKDLRFAHISVHLPAEGAARQGVIEALERAKGFLRKCIATALTSKRVPELRFQADESLDAMGHIDDLLAESRKSDYPMDPET
jgi:ribosome-binding factor A